MIYIPNKILGTKMKYTTEIDTIRIQVDYTTENEQKDLLFFLKEYAQNLGLHIDSKDYTAGEEYFIYANNSKLEGVFGAGSKANGYGMQYYVSIKFSGLKTYSNLLDVVSKEYLLRICAFLNTRGISFKLTELDLCIDTACAYEHIWAICTTRPPRKTYDDFHDYQNVDSITNIEKIPSPRSEKAFFSTCVYDKREKENLPFNLTRFEIKLRPKYVNKYNFDTATIAKAFSKYYLMYFESIEEKCSTINAYNTYQTVRRRERKILGLDRYRLHADMGYIDNFIKQILTITEFDFM